MSKWILLKRFWRRPVYAGVGVIIAVASYLFIPVYGMIVSAFAAFFAVVSILPCKPICAPPPFEDWLNAHPEIRDAIILETSSGVRRYSEWGILRKYVLYFACSAASDWLANPVPEGSEYRLTDPPPNILPLQDDDSAGQVLDEANGVRLYMAYVGHGLALEMGNHVPWSLSEYDHENLRRLFDSRYLFTWREYLNGYEIRAEHHSRGIPAPPDFTFKFFKDNDLLQPDRVTTIARVINWCRDNMAHFMGGFYTDNVEAHWQYRGHPPISRVINGTVSDYFPEWGEKHWTAGCRGTVGFFRAVLRAVNIPAVQIIMRSHALPHFTSEDLYLTHGDDPYSALAKATPLPEEVDRLTPGENLLPPARYLLIDSSQYFQLFGDHLSDQIRGQNIGRQVRWLAIAYLPDYLLHTHCNDLAAGRSHEESYVLRYDLDNDYIAAYLEYLLLWRRMDDKIAKWGGCENIPTDHGTGTR